VFTFADAAAGLSSFKTCSLACLGKSVAFVLARPLPKRKDIVARVYGVKICDWHTAGRDGATRVGGCRSSLAARGLEQAPSE